MREKPVFMRRRGMTLIELLIVAGIMTLLVTVAAPLLNPVAEGRQARETVRGIQAALDTARARALRLGRPCGVAFIPFENDRKVCIQLDQVTAPPSVASKCSVSNGRIESVTDTLGRGFRVGDRLQVNYTGPWYRYNGSQWLTGTGFGSRDFALCDQNGKVDCTIRYAPVPESGNPFAKALGLDTGYSIPKGVVVDLFYSGVGTGYWGSNVGTVLYPPTVLFYPDGTMSLYVNGRETMLSSATSATTDYNVYLLVGRWDRGLQAAEDGQHNTQDPNAFWVVVNPKTGMVNAASNVAFDGNSAIIGSTNIAAARSNAISGNWIGGE